MSEREVVICAHFDVFDPRVGGHVVPLSRPHCVTVSLDLDVVTFTKRMHDAFAVLANDVVGSAEFWAAASAALGVERGEGAPRA